MAVKASYRAVNFALEHSDPGDSRYAGGKFADTFGLNNAQLTHDQERELLKVVAGAYEKQGFMQKVTGMFSSKDADDVAEHVATKIHDGLANSADPKLQALADRVSGMTADANGKLVPLMDSSGQQNTGVYRAAKEMTQAHHGQLKPGTIALGNLAQIETGRVPSPEQAAVIKDLLVTKILPEQYAINYEKIRENHRDTSHLHGMEYERQEKIELADAHGSVGNAWDIAKDIKGKLEKNPEFAKMGAYKFASLQVVHDMVLNTINEKHDELYAKATVDHYKASDANMKFASTNTSLQEAQAKGPKIAGTSQASSAERAV